MINKALFRGKDATVRNKIIEEFNASSKVYDGN
jgi:hypothetical protein